MTKNGTGMLQIAEQAAGLPPGLLQAIVAVESRGRAYAVNRKSQDYGLMQINAAVGQRMGYKLEQLLDAQTSVQVAVKLLMYKRKRFGHQYRWECRYNVGTAVGATTWNSCINYYNKLLLAGFFGRWQTCCKTLVCDGGVESCGRLRQNRNAATRDTRERQ